MENFILIAFQSVGVIAVLIAIVCFLYASIEAMNMVLGKESREKVGKFAFLTIFFGSLGFTILLISIGSIMTSLFTGSFFLAAVSAVPEK
jgi:hypothetical protein